ncbi:hypothetical protein PtrSN002B_008748 [Pyrenophora tritici-repentis]|uniref:Atrophin-1 multi-domain protein n=1 Tax=Pyrenophora tritici-repentis TaxID=45151 RepID=A0A2W1GAM2_9PLEO|nr:hypothetical protein PtrV1_02459 [Pyrenophora tritici-repentis]KAF7455213.1 hypothetical protein A1F99_024710 [Pyrenophora tritici-repentis]KAF7578378.1 Atrophin-1 multi-domain protein [Pyrenophora tritici-repentis]KAI0574979.1 hypothetical protein Alg130_09456 [Pyrenophora tritici-repentis]KAI0606495.1 hypothetical protein TUN205_09256 [Pyrenophora tritici-repentis]
MAAMHSSKLSNHFSRHRSGSYLSIRSSNSTTNLALSPTSSPPSKPTSPATWPLAAHATNTRFEGTDALPTNRKVALQRVIEAHQALEAKANQATTPTSTSSDQRPTSSSSSLSPHHNENDRDNAFAHNLNSIPLDNVELRAFRYFQRMWDPRNPAWRDEEFYAAIAPWRTAFEETALKHFFSRVAMWDASLEVRESMSRSIFQRPRRSRAKSDLSNISATTAAERDGDDELKKATSREGLAQLLWTLLQDPKGPLEGLQREIMVALKEWFCLKNLTTGQRYGS